MKIEGGIKNQRQNNAGGVKNKVLLSVLIIILIFIAFTFIQGWRRTSQVDQEIAGLGQEINTLEQDNLEFQELIEYFNSDAYIEEKARLDLGLKKDGENVVVVNTNEEVDQIEEPSLSEYITQNTEETNLQRWWSLFFK